MMVPELEIASFRSRPLVAAAAEASDSMPSTQPWCYGYVHDAAASDASDASGTNSILICVDKVQ